MTSKPKLMKFFSNLCNSAIESSSLPRVMSRCVDVLGKQDFVMKSLFLIIWSGLIAIVSSLRGEIVSCPA